MKIAILYGGISSEHKISIKTAFAIAEAISKKFDIEMIHLNGHISTHLKKMLSSDLVINALHGGDGEDGTIQAYLDLHHIPYTGSGAKASKISMDKNHSKIIAQSLNISTPKWFLIKRSKDFDIKSHYSNISKFDFPFVVKPSDEGSTHGLTIIQKNDDIEKAIIRAFEFSDEILVEKFISGRELTIGILGDKTLPIVEIKPSHDHYDYDCKYKEGLSDYVVPAQLSDSLRGKISEDAMKIHEAIGCRHYSRVDFRINDNGEYYFLEINTLPGMTSTSLLPKAAKAAGLDFIDLIQTIINMAKME
ncbi:MAG: D-alanine--D-alanine ligase [Candidatus Neomarinimicrobiota bacterium]|nr:D-alanine--D-alanine ligase [Candidatus Neomarinimicrobiota bacterium]